MSAGVIPVHPKARRNPPASALHIARECPSAFALPASDEVTDAAEQGLALHAYVRALAGLGPAAALALVPEEHREAAELLDVEKLPTDPAAYAHEVAISLNLDTGEAVEVGRGENVPMPNRGQRWVNVRIDVVAIYERDGARWVRTIDLKTGGALQVAARRSAQGLTEGLAAARLFDAVGARVEILHAPPGRRPTFDHVELDAFGLDAWAEELREIIDRVHAAREMHARGAELKFRAGAHCRYCPALPYCPLHRALIRSVLADPEKAEREIILGSDVAAAYTSTKILRGVVERIERSIYAHASANPIDLGDGRVLGPVATRRTTIDGGIAYEVLAERFSPEVAELATRATTTKKALRLALRHAAGGSGHTVAELEREVYGAIGRAGGLTSKETVAVREHLAGEGSDDDE